MSDRDLILDAVRRACASRTVHPGGYVPPSAPAPWQVFATSVQAAGGEVYGPIERFALAEAVTTVCRSTSGVPARLDPEIAPALGEGEWAPVHPDATPAALADTEIFVAPGCVGVAENGAVGVLLPDGPRAAALFLCQHLILTLEVAALEPEMHRGLERLLAVGFSCGRCVWVSGPSKTADIEQTLVLGAHGPRTLTVVGVRGSELRGDVGA